MEEKVALIDLFDKLFRMLETWNTTITIPTRKSEEEKGQTQEVGLANAKDISSSSDDHPTRLGPEMNSDWPAGINTECSSNHPPCCPSVTVACWLFPRTRRARGSRFYELTLTKPTNTASSSLPCWLNCALHPRTTLGATDWLVNAPHSGTSGASAGLGNVSL